MRRLRPWLWVFSGVITAEQQEPHLWIPIMPSLAQCPHGDALEIQSISQRLALAVAAVFSKQVQI